MAGAAWAGLEESGSNSPFFLQPLDFTDRCGPRKPAVLDFTHFYLILVYAVSAGVQCWRVHHVSNDTQKTAYADFPAMHYYPDFSQGLLCTRTYVSSGFWS